MKSLLLLAAAGCAADEHTVKRTIEVDGRERRYLLHVPPAARGEKAAPLLLVLHGGGGSAKHTERFTKFSALSDREGFLVAYPDAVAGHWNDGRGTFTDADDVKFAEALIDAVAKDHAVDPRRVYAAGASNGGIMSQYLALKLSRRIAAIACVIGSVAKPAAGLKPDAPVSVLIMNGTDDPLVPFDGGAVARSRGEVIGTRDAVRLWVRANGCREAPEVEELPDADPKDGTRIVKETWPGGRGGSEVVLYTVKGGGHTWPGGSQYLAEALIGKTSRDLDATSEIWKFLSHHARE
ncbi:MAG: esterase [Planctomycetes bacterium]|nr:esterase [Planctomycetota bacterium]